MNESYSPSEKEASVGDRLKSMLNWRVIGFTVFVMTAASIPYFQERFLTFLAAEILIFGIVALGYNVLLGYTGLLSFGHAAFFGGAGYTIGLLFEYTEIQSFIILIGAAILIVVLMSAIMGFISVRHTGVYYALLMLALAQVLYLVISKNYTLTNGTDGLRIAAPTIFGVDYVEQLGYNLYLEFILYFIILVTFIIVVASLYRFMSSPFGLTLQTIRENPERAKAIGIPVKRYRWYASILSGVTVGIGGVMYALLIGRVTPGSTLNWTLSGEIAFMAILGGPTTFFGPVIGAGIFLLLRTYILSTAPDAWLLILGSSLYLMVVFFPSGVYGALRSLVSNIHKNGIKDAINPNSKSGTDAERANAQSVRGGDQD